MNVLKRDNTIAEFDKSKISNAILKAMKSGAGNGLKSKIAEDIANEIEEKYASQGRDQVSIHEIENDVFDKLITKKQRLTAKAYEDFRKIREFQRETTNTIDNDINTLVEDKNERWNTENANKNPVLNTTKRDYMAGIVSTDATNRYLLPPDIVQAHKDGIIHFHDADYYLQKMHNCDLVNLDDMLQNGTVISETLIESPHEFSTACNIATQIIAQVASSQYGGQSISLEHLAPFVDVSRKAFIEEVEDELKDIPHTDDDVKTIVHKRLMKEIRKGVQTIQYQLVTLMTTNGQAPFITIFMYLNEARNEQTKKDLALLIEEVLRQRMQGTKNKEGVWVAPAFPKLIYVLENDNVYEGQPYFYLTKLAVKCSSKRLVPDYISEKVMLSLKGDVYTCINKICA